MAGAPEAFVRLRGKIPSTPIRSVTMLQVMSNGVEASYFGDMIMAHQLNHQEAISNLNFLYFRGCSQLVLRSDQSH